MQPPRLRESSRSSGQYPWSLPAWSSPQPTASRRVRAIGVPTPSVGPYTCRRGAAGARWAVPHARDMLLLGISLRRSGRLPDNAAIALNGFLVHISLPALILAYVHELHVDARLILPALMPWIMFGLGCAYFWFVGRAPGFSPATTGGLMLTGGLANTAFIGLPMIEAFYGT